MVIDKGIGCLQLKDVLATANSHMQFWKFGFGTSCLYSPEILLEKNQLLQQYGITSFPGGTLFEAAYTKNLMERFFYDLAAYQFTAVEISDGTIDIPQSDRKRYIGEAKRQNLLVFSEIGKKNETGFQNMLETVKADLDCGADYVILEGRESGTSGLYTKEGEISTDILDTFANDSDLLPYIIWEAPCKDQQAILINFFGACVNLGNVAANDVIALAALRRGLRSDTFKKFLS